MAVIVARPTGGLLRRQLGQRQEVLPSVARASAPSRLGPLV